MHAHYLINLKAVLLAGVLMLLNSTNILAVTPACGSTLTANTTFDADMNCPSLAIFLSGAGSNNVILDCAGFTISVDDGTGIQAVDVSDVTIENCEIDTASGVGILGSSIINSEISNNTITTANTFSAGISLSQSSNNLVDGNTISATGPSSRGIQIQNQSLGNVVSNNNVVAASSNGLRLRSGSDFNTFTENSFTSNSSTAVSIQSSSDNQFTGNTLSSPTNLVFIGKLSLQNGGMSVDSSGNLFAVENDFGSSGGSGGNATTLFKIDPITGVAISYRRLMENGEDPGFGFDSLEILPDGRFLATRGGNNSSLYEINPLSGEVSLIPLTLPALNGGLNGLQVVDNNTLLATTNQGELVRIDLVTSTGLLLGEDSIGWTDLAMHPTSGRLYVSTRWSTEPSGTSHLWEIDPANGEIIGEEIGDTGIPFLADIDFSTGGVLYGNNGLVVIDETTGVGTYIGNYGEDPNEPPSLNNRFDNAECDIQLSQSIYNDGDTVTAEVFRIANMSGTTLQLEWKVWLGLPGAPPVSIINVGADGSFSLPDRDVELGPLPLLPVSAGTPPGFYEFSCRFLDPVTGELLAEDRNFFEIQ